ncbi:TetR/AcrR family transcriptional regulator [Paenibacillus sp. Marseille-Q4541]|uniref:TetR/AcrR family transcriptional regulator n=1 Tax=Paenibacillus sp. Marseille-Q4541 TaxID=2831522 RepID=UPI001BA57763|nr:TetR/AcrR family transcriptional regulator [Paenibacillus sp. Marseille-Q4541]
MSSTSIKQVALTQFALEGYEGASLRKIAEEVGIKKPSIYAHYKNKEDLFLHVVRFVFQLERRRILAFFQEQMELETTLELRLRGLFDWIQEEFESQDAARFLMRMTYFPPQALHGEVMDIVYPFLDGLERTLAKFIASEAFNGKLSQEEAMQFAIAYMTLIDGVSVELLYGGSVRYQKRLQAAWPVFWEGILHLYEKKESTS